MNGYRTVMEIDAIGTFATSRAAFPALQARGGSIINISATLHYGATWWQVPASLACCRTWLCLAPALSPCLTWNVVVCAKQVQVP